MVLIRDKQTFCRDVAATYEGIKPIDLVPNLSPQNLVSVEIGKDFMRSHGYIKNDFDVKKWAAPEFLEQAAKELLEQQWKKVSTAKLPDATGCWRPRRGSGNREVRRSIELASVRIVSWCCHAVANNIRCVRARTAPTSFPPARRGSARPSGRCGCRRR
jgi:hypothetical protein